MTRDEEHYDIVEEYGMPRKDISCPGCGRVYGAYNRRVCINCEECSKCCNCGDSGFVSASQFIKHLQETL